MTDARSGPVATTCGGKLAPAERSKAPLFNQSKAASFSAAFTWCLEMLEPVTALVKLLDELLGRESNAVKAAARKGRG